MDRTYRGIIAGVIGGLSMQAWDLFSYYVLKFGSFRYLDWAGMMIYGEPPQNFYETIMSFTMQIIWAGLLGVFFAFLIPKLTSRGYLLKGIFYSLIAFFIIYAIPVLYQVPHLYKTGPNTQFSHFIGAIIFGAATAITLRWLNTSPKMRI